MVPQINRQQPAAACNALFDSPDTVHAVRHEPAGLIGLQLEVYGGHGLDCQEYVELDTSIKLSGDRV